MLRKKKALPHDKKDFAENFALVSVRSPKAPTYWRAIDNKIEENQLGIESPFLLKDTAKVWSLVLSSRFIPHIVVEDFLKKPIKKWTKTRIFVPSLWEIRARTELHLYTEENIQKIKNIPSIHVNIQYILLILFPLILFHAFRVGYVYFSFNELPNPEYWLEIGKLNTFSVLSLRQYWRVITAITLHADIQHLLGNVVFSALFLIVLARRFSVGLATFLGLLASMLANLLSVLYHNPSYSSIGFSTTLFSFIGIASADMMIRGTHGNKAFIFLPFAAGVGLLAMLGMSGERTDYIAHILGLFCGILIGIPASYTLLKYPIKSKFLDSIFIIFSLLTVFSAWRYAIIS